MYTKRAKTNQYKKGVFSMWEIKRPLTDLEVEMKEQDNNKKENEQKEA